MANQTGRYTTTYDDLRRKRTVVTPVGKTITYSYDALSRKAQMQVADAGVFTYSYDANNQLAGLQNPQNDRTSFSYDAAGRRILKELANGTRATYLYDPAGNMTRVANLKSDNSVISQFDYTYDPVGNKIRISTAAGGVTTYSYDNIYRLTEEHRTGPNAYQNTYSYDPTGNRILTIKDGARTTSTFDPANQNVYSLDANGRTTYTFDQSGNQVLEITPSGNRTTSIYDYENQQTLIQLPNDLCNTMAYDPDGLRVQLDNSSGTKKFVYDDQAYLLDVNGSNVITAVYTQEPTTYGGLASQYRFNGSLWIPSYYHSDSLGNTSELTDETEAVTDIYEYDAFGEVLSKTGGTTNVFQFGGLWGAFTDPDTSRVYIRARIYLPWNGRWTVIDPAGFVDGMNLYLAYFIPNGVDPSGEARLSFKTVQSPNPGQCGAMSRGWIVQWLLAEPSQKGGWIIQHVTVSADIKDCDGKNLPFDTSRWPLWEAWRVDPKWAITNYAVKGSREDDTFLLLKVGGKCTKGTLTMTGTAEFYEGLTLPDGFKRDRKGAAGDLPATKSDPGILPGGTGSISHILTLSWNCCPALHFEKTTITHD